MHICICTYLRRPVVNFRCCLSGARSQELLCYFLREGLSLGPKVCPVVRLTWQLALGICMSSSSQHWNYKYTPPPRPRGFYMNLELGFLLSKHLVD